MSCPVCTRRVDPHYRPFCSRRCADVDLARWLNGSYTIPVQDDEAEPPAPDPKSDATGNDLSRH